MSKYARKKDRTHDAVVSALRAAGYRVLETYQFPGLLDAWALSKTGKWAMFEIKSPGGKVTEAEQEFLDCYGGYVVYSADQALEIMYALEGI